MSFLELFLLILIILLLYIIYLYTKDYKTISSKLENIKFRLNNMKDIDIKTEHNTKEEDKKASNKDGKIFKKKKMDIKKNHEINEYDENGEKWSYI